MWKIVGLTINGNITIISENLSEEKANEYVYKLNKKCNWTRYCIATPMAD